MIAYQTLRPALFQLSPELAHRTAIRALQLGLAPKSHFTHPSLGTTVAGLALPSPVGLAAGFDKNAEAFDGCLKAGFGFVEIGTVTPRSQPGNARPRMFRLTQQEAVINRLGFNNDGAPAAAMRLQKRGDGIIGGNVGKNKDGGDVNVEYATAMAAVYPYVDYITANISSPNTVGLRSLQYAEPLAALVANLHRVRATLVESGQRHKPIFVKIAPDNDAAMLEAIAQVALETGLDGLIVSNTTIGRVGVEGHINAEETGGLSGKPLFTLSTDILRRMYALTQGKVPLIGVGGIASAEDAYAKICAGASAVQLYTALVYQGFELVEQIHRGLVALLARDGFSNVVEAVGKDHSHERQREPVRPL